MRINTNLTAMNTYNQYTKNNSKIAGSVAKLSSGYAINTAADNAAGLAISEKMRAQIRGLDKASSNAQDAISLVQTAEGALDSSTEILQRMREIAVQSSSDTNNDAIDRDALQDEFSQLQNELNEVAQNTTFNKKNLLDGSLSTNKDKITGLALANSTLGVSTGKVAAGSYTFTCAVKTVSAAIAGDDATATTSFTSDSTNYINAAQTEPTTANGVAFDLNSQYNGNYSLSTKIETDGSITVTATGDNDQTFQATISAASLTAGINNAVDLTLNFGEGANDGFTMELDLTNSYTDSANAKEALCNDIETIAISVGGGVDQKDATHAAFATLNGGEDIKLAVGDTSVTFSNGVTVSFDKLTTADLTVTDGNLSDGLADKLGLGTETGTTTNASAFTVDKSENAGLTFQVGANEGDAMTINIDRMDAEYLGVNSAKVSTQEAAASAMSVVDDAINQVSSQRAYLGAIQNRLDYKISNLETSSENLTSAESQIRDVDMAKEMTKFTNANILQQAATAMLAQANSLPQNVLSLIGG